MDIDELEKKIKRVLSRWYLFCAVAIAATAAGASQKFHLPILLMIWSVVVVTVVVVALMTLNDQKRDPLNKLHSEVNIPSELAPKAKALPFDETKRERYASVVFALAVAVVSSWLLVTRYEWNLFISAIVGVIGGFACAAPLLLILVSRKYAKRQNERDHRQQ